MAAKPRMATDARNATATRMATDTRIATAFVRESRRRLRDEYLRKIRRAVRDLGPEDIWWRPNKTSNSIGNLLLHLDGNVRQWVVHGIGGERDVRRRDAEFAARGATTGAALVRRLAATLRTADAVLATLDAVALQRRRSIQGYRVSTLEAVYHVVEHFAGHTGQILYIAKTRLDRDLALYPDLAANRAKAKSAPIGSAGRSRRRGRRFLRPPDDIAWRARRA